MAEINRIERKSDMSSTRKAIWGCLAASALMFAGSAYAQTIIVKSSGPSAKTYFPGKQIAANGKIALQAGDSVTVVTGGGTKVFRGPGTYAANTKTQSAGLVGSVLNNTGNKQSRTGAVRGGMTMSHPSNIWMIDTSKSGKICYSATDKVSMWIPRRETQSSLVLKRVADGKSVPMEVRPGQMFAAWPVTELPLSNGSQFEVTRSGAAEPVKLQFQSVGVNVDVPETTVAAMVQAGCNGQLDLLIETTAVAPESDEEPVG